MQIYVVSFHISQEKVLAVQLPDPQESKDGLIKGDDDSNINGGAPAIIEGESTGCVVSAGPSPASKGGSQASSGIAKVAVVKAHLAGLPAHLAEVETL